MATYWENSCSFGLRYVSWYKYLIVSLVFSHLGLWSGNLFLIAPFPDLCLLLPSYKLEGTVLENVESIKISRCNKFKFTFSILFPRHLMYKHTYMAIKHIKSTHKLL